MNKNIDKLINCMKRHVTFKNDEDNVFLNKFDELVQHSDLVKDLEGNSFYIEYEEINMYYTVGEFKIGIVDHQNNKLKTYEVLLQYTYGNTEGYNDGWGDIPDVPTIVVNEG